MTGPVIVGVDGGATGTDALALARWTADTLQAQLIVAVVHPAPAALGSGRVDAEWVADRHRAAQRVLDGARAVLTEAGPDGSGGATGYRMIASSSAAHGLHDLAEQTGAEVIVVGSGKNAAKHRLSAGSTAERLLAGSVCPIAVAPAGMTTAPGALGRIGVAYVDTPDGRAALAQAARLARRTGAALRLHTVVAEGDASLPFLIGDGRRAGLPGHRPRDVRAVPGRRGRIGTGGHRRLADQHRRRGRGARRPGRRGRAVLRLRGYGPARRVLLGGVSTRLVRRARRPLVVVPRSG